MKILTKVFSDRSGAITITEIMLGVVFVGLMAITVYTTFKVGFTDVGSNVNDKMSNEVTSWQ